MKFRNLISLGIALSFCVLSVTGIMSFFYDYSRTTASVHTFFGLVFLAGVVFHIRNNFKPLSSYLSRGLGSVSGEFLFAAVVLITLFSVAFFQKWPLVNVMDWGAGLKAKSGKAISFDQYELYDMDLDHDVNLHVDLLRGEHYWHPQIAIWVEDPYGEFIKTLFITKATAKGLFFGGRTKDNFKSFDQDKDWDGGDYRRVDALPVWSHKKGGPYPDGSFAPPSTDPLPDAISGATPIDNFILNTSVEKLSQFVLKLEINVAFDDNEFYSEYDFPEDEAYHSGTGLTGQPSLVFSADIDLDDGLNYYLMALEGHGHHSGQTGEIYPEISSLTTALNIVERIVVGVKSGSKSVVPGPESQRPL